MQDMDLDAACLVRVEGVVAYAEDARVDLGSAFGFRVLEAGVAEVDACCEVWVGAEAFGRDVGCGDAELEGWLLVSKLAKRVELS